LRKSYIEKHNNRYIRSIKPTVTNFRYANELIAADSWDTLEGGFWGHPEMLAVKKKNKNVIIKSHLYMPESRSDDKDNAVADFYSKPFNLNIFCEDIFGDG